MSLGERSGPYGIVYEPCSFIFLLLLDAPGRSVLGPPSSPLRCFSGIPFLCDERFDDVCVEKELY